MNALLFVATARFVRVFLPPYDKKMKQREELPDYKIELFSCGDAPKGKGKMFGRIKTDFFLLIYIARSLTPQVN